MFTAYIDDSGTDPNQKVAMSTALVIPANRLIDFQAEWNMLTKKWGITDFHASQCAAANTKYDFAGWDEAKVKKAFERILQITKKFGIRAYSLAVNKADYNEIVPTEDRHLFGHYHYTYAVQNLLSFLDDWACRSGVEHPLEFVFDWMDVKSQKIPKKEIEDAIARSEAARPGRFIGHYAFRNRTDYPGLQCVDLIGWTCYRFGLNTFNQQALTDLQNECWQDLSNYKKGKWLTSIGQTKQQIGEAVQSLKEYDGKSPLQVRPHIRTLG